MKPFYFLGLVFSLFFVKQPVFSAVAEGFAVAPDSISRRIMDGRWYTLYAVGPGETLEQIAASYEISEAKLIAINPGLKTKTVRVGTLLYIPYDPEVAQRQKEEKIRAKAVADSVKAAQLAAAPPATPAPAQPMQPAVAKKQKPVSVQKPENPASVKKNLPKVMVIPFDPHLYFSDADDEIAENSNIARQQVRQVFRSKLPTAFQAEDYRFRAITTKITPDSAKDTERIYRSFTYGYQEAQKPAHAAETEENPFKKLLRRNNNPDKDNKYYGVTVLSPDVFTFLNTKFKADYYVLLNQFEIQTIFEKGNPENFERNLLVHYSVFDKSGQLLSGNKSVANDKSGNNSLEKMLHDNLPAMAQKIIADLPPAATPEQ